MAVFRLRVLHFLNVTGELAGWHQDYESGANTAEAAQAALTMDGVWDWWDAGVQSGAAGKTLWTSGVTLEKVTFQRITVGDIGPVYEDDRVGIAGTFAGNGLLPEVCVVASYGTAVSARRQKGRSYLPYPPASVTGSDGVMTTAHATDVRDTITELATELESAARVAVGEVSMNHVIYSTAARDPDPPHALLPPATFGVTRYRVGSRVDTQRKRLGKEQTYV